jgi:hypothetical protein
MTLLADDAVLFQDFGPVIALIIIMVTGGKWILQKSFDQVEESRKEFANYVETTSKEHTEAMKKLAENISVLASDLEEHTRTKDQFIETINDQRKTINDLFEMLKEQIKTNRR